MADPVRRTRSRPDRLPPGLVIRPLAPSDSFAALTALIHRAYAPLGAAGMNFTGVDQNEEKTRERCGRGATFVAEADAHVVATLTVAVPESSKDYGEFATPTSWHLEQFAVEPLLQGTGVGRALVAAAERYAKDHGATTILGDTSERARHLITLYERAGYRVVGHMQWPGKTYRSVVMEKRVARDAAGRPAGPRPRN
jgi:GNAT superfamily N-acetyltransferase